jgi:hypothetical protein
MTPEEWAQGRIDRAMEALAAADESGADDDRREAAWACYRVKPVMDEFPDIPLPARLVQVMESFR